MQIKDVDSTTEEAFLCCLHLEKPLAAEALKLRRRWYDHYKSRGLRAKVGIDNAGKVCAMAQYVPIEISPFIGENLAVILCMWVHGYDHYVGNVQRRGYGKMLLEHIEAEAAASGFAGVVAWGMDFPYWNPVSWYLSRGYEKCDQRGLEVLVWKIFNTTSKTNTTAAANASDSAAAAPPEFIKKPKSLCVDSGDKPVIDVYLNGWCTGGCTYAHQASCAAKALGDAVEIRHHNIDDKADMLACNIDFGTFINGQPYREFEEPWTTETLIEDLKKLIKP